jgi:hypothetical protein
LKQSGSIKLNYINLSGTLWDQKHSSGAYNVCASGSLSEQAELKRDFEQAGIQMNFSSNLGDAGTTPVC